MTEGAIFVILVNICEDQRRQELLRSPRGPIQRNCYKYQHPHPKNVLYFQTGGSFLCTATIISSRHAITAASCTDNNAKSAAANLTDNDNEGLGLSIIVGEHNLFESDPGQMR